MSPVGSPSLNSPLQRNSPDIAKKSQQTAVEATQQDDVAEEPDDDDTGTHTHNTTRSGGLKSLFPTLSTSKYAQSRRNKTQLPPGVSKPQYWIKDQGTNKVEGKVWLANQRTFIKWQHVSILLATLSLGLFNAAGPTNTVGRVLGVVYTCIALFAGIWGYGIYMWRSDLIYRRSGKDFDSVAGPVIVCVSLIVALILNFAFKYQAIMKERGEADLPQLMQNQTQFMVGYGEL